MVLFTLEGADNKNWTIAIFVLSVVGISIFQTN